MASEPKRGCGYRKVGGTYLVGGGIGIPCDRLPLELSVCPTCGHGIKQTRGWTWVDVNSLVQGRHSGCDETSRHCPLCQHPDSLGKAGLLWIGEQFYKTPDEFVAEGRALGFSRRIKAVPRNFKIGETWVLLAHPKAIRVQLTESEDGELLQAPKFKMKPGIFYVWKPERVERIFKESDRNSDEVKKAEKVGITPVFFEDTDTDHQGSLWDKSAA